MNIERLTKRETKPELIVGDFNFCHISNTPNPTRKYLQEHKFNQLVREPTHIEGNLLDQALMRDERGINEYSVELHSKYYTDHKAVAIMVNKR